MFSLFYIGIFTTYLHNKCYVPRYHHRIESLRKFSHCHHVVIIHSNVRYSVKIYCEASLHYLRVTGTVVTLVSPDRASTILLLLLLLLLIDWLIDCRKLKVTAFEYPAMDIFLLKICENVASCLKFETMEPTKLDLISLQLVLFRKEKRPKNHFLPHRKYIASSL